MRNALRVKGKSFTNWITNSDGSITERPVKIYTVGDGQSGIYELEICSKFLGLVLETDFHGVHTVVKNVDVKHSDSAVQAVVTPGDVLVSVNNHVVLDEEFEDIIDYLNILRDSNTPRRLRFLNTANCPIAVYRERLALGKRRDDRTDVYGFIRSEEYLQDEKNFMMANMSTLTRRDHDWITYLKSIGGSINLKPFSQHAPSPQLKIMVRRGIPAAFRPLLWQHISLSYNFKNKFPKGYYETLLSQIKTDMCATVQLDIAKDVGRTFPDHEVLNSEKGQASLSVVLSALAIHNPDIGYCQSLNFIAGTLLLFLSEEDSFWLMCVITECLLPGDYYSVSMTGTYLDQQVLEELVRQKLPAIDSKLNSFGLQLSLCSIQWFMCLFVNTLRVEPALRVWDIFLNEGSLALFRIAIGLLKLHEDEILECTDTSSVYMCLKSIGTNLVDADDLIRVSFAETGLPESAGTSGTVSSKRVVSLYQDMDAKSRGVPEKLKGLGLGHIGWQSQESSTPTVSQDSSKTMDTLSVENTYNLSSGEATDPTSKDCVSSLSNNKMDSDSSTIFSQFQQVRVDTSEWDILSYPTCTSSDGHQRIQDYSYRQFSHRDISNLRAKFRPEVEERLEAMSRQRRKMKEEREKLEMEQKKKNSDDKDNKGMSTSSNCTVDCSTPSLSDNDSNSSDIIEALSS